MKKLLIIMISVIYLTLAGCQQEKESNQSGSNGSTKLGVVNIQKVLSQSKKIRQIELNLQNTLKPTKNKIKQYYKELQNLHAKLRKTKATDKQERKKLKVQISTLNKKMHSEVKTYKKMQRTLGMKMQLQIKNLSIHVLNIIMKKDHLGGVLIKQAVLQNGYALKDITKQMMSQMGGAFSSKTKKTKS